MVKDKTSNRRSLIPTQQTWTEAGDKVEGVLLQKESTIYQDKTRGRYMVQTENGLMVFMGGFQIDQALSLVNEGDHIGVEYTGEETGAGVNKMKVFDIWVDDGEAVTENSGQAFNEANKVDTEPPV